jgi:cell division protein FtsN
MEYTVSAGIVEDSVGSRFSKATVNYGVTRSLTVGGGVEYLSSLISNPAMPFLNASLRITNNLLLSGDYTYKVRSKGTLSYRLPSNLQLDLNYTRYSKDQKAINYNYLEERKAVLSMPLKIGKFYSYQRFSVYQIVLPSSDYIASPDYTTGEWLFSGSVAGISTNLTTYALFAQSNNPYVYSNLSLGFRFPADIVFMPQAQYTYTENRFISAKLSLEKHLTTRAFLNLSYEKVFTTGLNLAELGFRYDFSFAQTGASVRQSGKRTALIQYARGSLINDAKTRFHGADNRTNVGKGGISIVPFLDLNGNGKKDPGEPKVYGLNLHSNSGRIEKSDRDSTIRILGLEPYTHCFIELDPNSFDNISWRLPYQTISVAVDPNILKNISIPITAVGEATGKVLLDKDGERKGIGRIIVNFYNGNLRPTGRTLTEDDGYFSFFGFAPGKYTVRIDTSQLRKLGMNPEPGSLAFNIDAGIDGDVADRLDFILKMKPSDTTANKLPETQKPVIRKDTAYMVVHEVTQELVTITEDSYAIQMGAFLKKANAENMRKKIEKILNKKLEIVVEDNFYKVRVSNIKTREEVDREIAVLHQNGINEVWVISLKAKHQQYILKERQDTVTRITESTDISNLVAISPELLIQLGAFNLKSNAMKLRDLVASKTDSKVIIVEEGGYYKVRLEQTPLIDQTVLDVMKKLEGSIGKLGLKDFWVLPLKTQPPEEPAVIKRETAPETVERKIEVPAIEKPMVVTPELKEEKIVPPVVRAEPKFSLQVGVYYKQSDALRAQRKITSKLKLPVEIVKQYEYYHVIVTGFYTREETYKYYPELAGLGYPSITLIERQ